MINFNPYRFLPTEPLLAAQELNRWDLSDVEENPDTWDYPVESRLFILDQIVMADAEITRRERVRNNPNAPAWPSGRVELDDIKQAIDLAQLVEALTGVRFSRAGKRIWTSCTLPGHTADSQPSFTIQPEKGLFFCFGCQRGGDAFRFVEILQNVPFHEAVNIVARHAGIDRVMRKPIEFPQRKQEVITVVSGATFQPIRKGGRSVG